MSGNWELKEFTSVCIKQCPSLGESNLLYWFQNMPDEISFNTLCFVGILDGLSISHGIGRSNNLPLWPSWPGNQLYIWQYFILWLNLLHLWHWIGPLCLQFVLEWFPSPHHSQYFICSLGSLKPFPEDATCRASAYVVKPWCLYWALGLLVCHGADVRVCGCVKPGGLLEARAVCWLAADCPRVLPRGLPSQGPFPCGRAPSNFPLALVDRLRFSSRHLVPRADRCSPSIKRWFSITSPLRRKKVSLWSMKTQPFSPHRSFNRPLTSSPFLAAALLSFRGHIPLKVTWPDLDIDFAVSIIFVMLVIIFSSGNFVLVSLVPTWMITSVYVLAFTDFIIASMSPVLPPPRGTTYNALSSFETTSLIVESPIRSIWPSFLVCLVASVAEHFVHLISPNDCTCADSVWLLSINLATLEWRFLLFSVNDSTIFTKSVIVFCILATHRGACLHTSHIHHADGVSVLVAGHCTQSSWYRV